MIATIAVIVEKKKINFSDRSDHSDPLSSDRSDNDNDVRSSAMPCLIDAKISLAPKHQLIVPSTLLHGSYNKHQNMPSHKDTYAHTTDIWDIFSKIERLNKYIHVGVLYSTANDPQIANDPHCREQVIPWKVEKCKGI